MAPTKRTFTAETPFGTFSRNSAREYTHCIARNDGWHQFSQSIEAAQKELRFQNRKVQQAVLVEVVAR